MRIGVITTSYPRCAGDWAGNFVGEHVAAMRALGHTVEVIAAGEPGDRDPDVTRIPSALFYQGGAPDLLASRGAWRHAASFSARLAAAVARRAHRWELAFAHWLAPSALAALVAPGTPLVAIAHGGDIHTLRRLHLLGPALHALHARGARLAFASNELVARARTAAPSLARWLDGALVQPMGVPLARFAALPRAPAHPARVAVIARLVALKGVDVAIRALAHLRAPVRLAIAGDGPARGDLERLAAGRADFLGPIDEMRRDRLLGEAAAIVVPSRVVAGGRSEGTPLVALEALAAGVPLVASAVGGLPALAPAARLVPPDDPQALAVTLDRVLAAPPAPPELQAAVAHLAWPDVAGRLLAHAVR